MINAHQEALHPNPSTRSMPIVENRRFQSRPRKKGDAGVTDSVALRLANLNFERSDPDELETTADQDAVQLIYRIVSFMKALKNTDEELFRIDLDTRGRRHYYQHPLGESFIRLCGRPMLPIVEAFPLHELNPWVKAFLAHTRHAAIYELRLHPNARFTANMRDWIDSLNKIVAELKIAMAQPSFRAAEKNWARRTSRARWRFFKLFKATLARHSKVMVVRIDFGLKRHELYNSKEPRTPWPQATVNPNAPHAGAQVQAEDQRLKNLLQQLGFDEIDTAREKSLRRIRDVFGSGLLGYIWKLEYGARKGFHYHCVFLLNGSVHRQDISIGNQIGKIWADYAPNGLGIFRNCNANRGYYKFPAVGMLQYHESRHWKGLSHIANYLSKPDYYVLLKLPSDQKHRTFGTSVIPRLTTNKPGPHRRKSFGLQGNPL